MDLDEDHRHHPSDPMLLDPRHPSSSPSLQGWPVLKHANKNVLKHQ